MTERMTVGYKCRFKKKCEQGKQWGNGDDFILETRSRGSGDFSVIFIDPNANMIVRNWKDVHGSLAWVDEDDMELVNTDINTNIRYIDWWSVKETEVCCDCGDELAVEGEANCAACIKLELSGEFELV